LVQRYVHWCRRRRWAILAAVVLLYAGGGWLASRLQLRTAFSELLPSDDPGVVTLAKTQQRMGDLSLLLIGVSSPDRQANLAYAELITQKLRELPPTVCALAAYHARELRTFLDDNKWLYLKDADLESIRDRLKTEIGKRKNPLFVQFSEDDETLAELKARVTPKDALAGKFDGGYFTQGKGEYVWIAALPPGGLFVEGAGDSLLQAATDIVARNPPEKFHPQMRAQVRGPIATALATRKAIERDILSVTLICLSVVAITIGLYFRQLRAVLLVGIPATLGSLLAFAFAAVVYGHLNSSTAFLGSIIVGNGINYAIVLLARYEEEKAKGHPLERALALAIGGVWRGTLVAALSASVAYGSLIVTSFRGFSQFGMIGAAGWLLCWGSTFLLLPVLVLTLDGAARTRTQGKAPARIVWLTRALTRWPSAFAGGTIVLTLLGLWGARHFMHDPFEYDFRKLTTSTQQSAEVQAFDRNLDALFGRWPSPTIVLADAIDDVEKLRTAIRRQDAASGNAPVIGQIATIFDLLPGTPETQQRRLAIIKDIRKLATDPALELGEEKEKQQLLDATPPANLRPLTPDDLPALARRPFTEADGTVGRVVLVYPVDKGLSVWNGHDLLRIGSVLQVLKLDDGRKVDTSGSAVVFGAMIRSILRDGPIATLLALVTVILTVSLSVRPWRAAAVALGTLSIGVIWMIGAAGWAGVRITFLNFIAVPITLGLGIEYALNVLARYREHHDIGEAVSATGGAVALCSWTTIVGYGSLLVAQNQALRGFGAMAILSEVACLSAAILALPAVLILAERRGRKLVTREHRD
jgi:predicted RND superfamily exporter protein